MWIHKAVLLALLPALAGCAGLPADFKLRDARVADSVPRQEVVLDRDGKKVGGGVARGASIGLVWGVMGCAPFGPAMPLCILATSPITVGTGLAIGAVVANPTDTPEELHAKRVLLRPAMEKHATPANLDNALRRRVGNPETTPPRWELVLAELNLVTDGHGVNKPFAIALGTKVELRPTGSGAVLMSREQFAYGTTRLTREEWEAADGAQLRAEIEALLALLAIRIECDFGSPPAQVWTHFPQPASAQQTCR